MSADLEFVDDRDPPLSSFQRAMIRAATVAIRHSRQEAFHAFIASCLRPVQCVTDRDVRRAIDEAARRYGRPA